MQRLDDAEFGRRQRERNLRANRQRRQRLMSAGYCQWNLWIAGDVRQQAEHLAAQRNQSPSELIAALVQSAALSPSPADDFVSRVAATTENTTRETYLISDPDPTPTLTPAERNRRILELHRQGVAGREIARQVGTSEGTVRRVLKDGRRMEATV